VHVIIKLTIPATSVHTTAKISPEQRQVMSKPNAKESRQRPEGDVRTTLGGFKGCMGFELREAGHKVKYMHLWLKSLGRNQQLST
jgi:hypothetical protein